jgi:outer membrane protein assembly factor BamB
LRNTAFLVLITISILTTLPATATQTIGPTLTPASPITFTPGPGITLTLNTTGTVTAQQLLWTANTTGTNYEESAVTVKDTIAYIGSCATHGDGHNTLFAVDTTSGDIIWSYPTGPGYVGPVIDGDAVYLGTCTHGYYPNDEHLYAFNRYTGDLLWTIPIYGGIAETIQTDAHNLYFGTGFDNTQIMAINKTTGATTWTYPTDNDVGPNKPMLNNNTVYVAFWKNYAGRLYKLNATTGQNIWTKTLSSGPWDNSITTDNHGRLFLAIWGDSTMNCYRDSDGSLLWTRPLHASPLSFNAYHQGHVFIADTSGTVYNFNATNGAPIWETKIGDDCDISSPTLAGGLLFIGTRDGQNGAFYALDEDTGTIQWTYPIGASVTCPPSIVGGTMYCGSDGWNMYAFDFGTGAGDWVHHRYDTQNTAYTPIGLAQWQYISASCTTQTDQIICTLDNLYDHAVTNITLKLGFPAYWYDNEGNILSHGSTCTLDMTAEQTRTLHITYTPMVTVSITRPQNAVYLANTKIISYKVPLAIGRLEIDATASTTVDKVEFRIDGHTTYSTSAKPYTFLWTQRSFGPHVLSVIAYDGNITASAELRVWKYF